MGIKNSGEDVIFIDLSHEEPQIAERLKKLNEQALASNDRDVVIDFSRVEIITSSDISNLLTLRALLREEGHRLVLCGVSILTKGIFTVAGIETVFEFAEDKQAALVAIQNFKDSSTHTSS
jgi:anti-anti-sigma regulatory factor